MDENIIRILMRNKEKNFVQRALNPHIFPRINNPDGSVSTHLMSAEVDEDGNWMVFPTITQGKDGKLTKRDLRDAQRYAIESGEHISFGKDKDAAINFSKLYKGHF